jgi:hypothetical protein
MSASSFTETDPRVDVELIGPGSQTLEREPFDLASLENYRVPGARGLDIFVVPRFAHHVLGFDARDLQTRFVSAYPIRRSGDEIEEGVVQWIDGSNAALKYRGNTLLRGTIWLQRGPTEEGYRRYGYTGWQWRVLTATADVAKCPEMERIANAYDRWALSVGAPCANHYIMTKYDDGAHNIGMHSVRYNDPPVCTTNVRDSCKRCSSPPDRTRPRTSRRKA